jgi:hypothetical protein
MTPVVSSYYSCGIFLLLLWYLLITPVVSSYYSCGIFESSEDTTGVIRRYHRSHQKIPQESSEDTTGVIRRYHRSNQKIPQE